MKPRKSVVGIDFSGAKDAGKRIWIAEGAPTAEGVRIARLSSVKDRFGPTDLETTLERLRGFLAETRSAIVGIDAPFSIPSPLMDSSGSWIEWLRKYRSRYETPEAMKEDLDRRSDGSELKRRTEEEATTPFSAYNLRLYKQTHHLIAGVLAPLVLDEKACALPMQHHRDDYPSDTPWLLEACPSSTLKALGFTGSYKGAKPEHEAKRREILEGLTDEHHLEMDADASVIAESDRGGDALDAAVCALAARRALEHPDSLHCEPTEPAAMEGRVYI